MESANALVGYLSRAYQNYREFRQDIFHNTKPWAWTKELCTITIESDNRACLIDPKPNETNPILAVLHNQLIRGFPTKAPINVEEYLMQELKITKKTNDNKTYAIEWEEQIRSRYTTNELNEKALMEDHGKLIRYNSQLIKKKTTIHNNLGDKHDSHWEYLFLNNVLPKVFEPGYYNLIRTQVKFKDLVTISSESTELNENMVDFFLPATNPYYTYGNNKTKICKGIIIELDGPDHDKDTAQRHDKSRDIILSKNNYEVIRIRYKDAGYTEENGYKMDGTQKIIKEHYNKNKDYWTSLFKVDPIIKKSDIENIFDKEEEELITRFQQVPQVVARVQYAIIRYLMSIGSNIDSEKPHKILIIEQDYEGGQLALENFKESHDHIANLSNCKPINLEWKTYKIDAEIKKQDQEVDLLIIVSTLNNQEYKLFDGLRYKNIIKVSSTKRHDQRYPAIVFAPPIKYNPIGKYGDNNQFIIDNEKAESLRYFLKMIYSKENFRPGQLAILNRSIQSKPVIGLLPTGSGKSITYQLTAMLQPGITIVIDPIKSLMMDQATGLYNNAIDHARHLNSSHNPAEKHEILSMLQNGETVFLLISPERLQMESFRNICNVMKANKKWVSYCVIDEAHCVSEWGHDFRTSYLYLSKNIQDYLPIYKTKEENTLLPIIALTATASFDVLTDIQRELTLSDSKFDDTSIIRSETEHENRNELKYMVLPIHMVYYNPINDQEQYLREAKAVIGRKWQNISSEYWQLANKHIQDLQGINIEGIPAIHTEINPEKDDSNNKITSKLEPYDKKISSYWGAPNSSIKPTGTILFTPHTVGSLGAEQNDERTITWSILQSKKDLSKYITLGTYFSGVKQQPSANKEQQQYLLVNRDQENINNQKNFIESKQNLIICTKAFGMGIDKSNVRSTWHLVAPGSIESFIQETGRAGRDRKISLCYALIDIASDENGNINKEKSGKIYSNVHDFFYNNNHPGAAEDNKVIKILTTKLEGNKPQAISRLERLVSGELDEKITMTLWSKPELDMIRYYINCKEIHNDSKIYISLEKEVIKVTHHVNAQNKQSEFEKDLVAILQKHLSNNEISPNLFILDSSNLPEIDLQPENTIFYSLTSIVREISHDKTKPTSYYLPNDILKAIHRLTIIGLFEDVEIDYVSEIAICKVSTVSHNTDNYIPSSKKIPSNTFLNKCYSYIRRYESETKSRNLINELAKSCKGKDRLQTIHITAEAIINYTYTHVSLKRKQATDDMKELLLETLINNKNDNNPFYLSEFMDLYFNSKYARPNHREVVNNVEQDYSLSVDTENGRSFDNSLSIIQKYLLVLTTEVENSTKDNASHLRGACMRLLRENPVNHILHFLLGSSLAFISIQQNSANKFDRLHEAYKALNKAIDYLQKNSKQDQGYDFFYTFEYASKTLDTIIKVLEASVNEDTSSTWVHTLKVNLLNNLLLTELNQEQKNLKKTLLTS